MVMGTIENLNFVYIFIISFISLIKMQNFKNFDRAVFEIFSFFFLKNAYKMRNHISFSIEDFYFVNAILNANNILYCQEYNEFYFNISFYKTNMRIIHKKVFQWYF